MRSGGNSPGFTLLELMLTVGIVSGVTMFALPAYRDYQVRNDLLVATDHVTQAIGRAQLRAQAGERRQPWGFSVSQRTLFMGPDFASRNAAFDERYFFPQTIGTSGLDEVSFAPLTGIPSATGAIILTSLRGEQRQVEIIVDRQGILVNDDDRLTICHCISNPPHTQRIPEASWPAHRQHGDSLGACHTQDPEAGCTN